MLPKSVEWIAARVGETPGHRLMVVLAAPGCIWTDKSGGCTNCGFAQGFGLGRKVSEAEYTAQLDAALELLPDDSDGPVQVDLFVSGSYLNPDEVPESAQAAMVRRAASVPVVKRVLVESRPEFVTEARLDALRDAVGAVELELGIGLESADDEVLTHRIKKGFTWKHFEAAVERLQGRDIDLLVYLLLKPIDTSEADAIEDLVESARRVFELGERVGVPTRIALEPCFVPEQTAIYDAYLDGRYRPPWLWSVIACLEEVAPLGPVHVGLSDEGLGTLQAAHNCAACTERVREALSRFNETQALDPLLALGCPCRADWVDAAGAGRERAPAE